MKVENLLQEITNKLCTIQEDDSVQKALEMMAANRVSALIATRKGKPKGIFTERDLLRCCILFSKKDIDSVPVKSVMTTDLIVAEPGDTVEAAMGMMIQAKIRHLPVMATKKIIAVMGLEDLVKHHVGALEQELHYLKDYIIDLQDAVHD